MIDIELSVKNYRCFGDVHVSLRFRDGFTALLGINNSGKSSLLRIPYEIRSLLQIMANNQSNWGDTLIRGHSGLGAIWHPTLLSGERIARPGADRPIEIDFIVRDSPKGRFAFEDKQLILTVSYDKGATSSILKTENGTEISAVRSGASVPGAPAVDIEPFKSAMQELSEAVYVGPFRNAINVGGQQSYYDIQIGDAFVKEFQEYKSGFDSTRNEAVYDLLQELKRIFGFNDLDLNAAPDNQTLQLMVDGRSYRLTEQGAGLAHFVVVLVNILIRRPSFLLIDEPELNLHASLQLDFLETLARYTKYGVVFATHSIGLARTAAEHIYCLAKPVGGTSTIRPYDGTRDVVTLLGQLSFDGRPDLGYSKVLLVEGKTELRALMQFLRFYKKEHQVLMIPLHGTDMINGDVEHELTSLLRIDGDVQYLIDSERDSENAPLGKSRQAFVDLCSRLGVGGHVLERRALENYFTDAAVKLAFGSGSAGLGPYDKKGAAQNWPKANNWRAAVQMSKSDIDGTDLGEFLERL